MLNLRSHFATVLSIGLAVLAGNWKASAEIKLPSVLSDHAVLQRETPIRVWG
jgi:sialate O-acetylesterase